MLLEHGLIDEFGLQIGAQSRTHGSARVDYPANGLSKPDLAQSAEGEGFEPSTRLNDV
jgi:hypothetical protein